jgi:uncharacterized protein YggE
MHHIERYLVCCAPLFVAIGCSSQPRVTVSGAPPYGQEGLRVTGTAVVRAKPDYALVTVGFQCSRAKAGEAKAELSAVMARVLKALKAQGIEDKNIQTVEYSLDSDYEGPQDSRQIAWSARNMVLARIEKVEDVSEVIDAATEAGANAIGSVEFMVDDMNALRAQARELAAKMARGKADQLAAQFGAKVGRVVAIQDGQIPTPWYGGIPAANSYVNATRSVGDAGSKDRNPDSVVSEGQISVEAREEVVFALE